MNGVQPGSVLTMTEMPIDPDAIAARLPAGRMPPVNSWNPDFSGDIDMRIARDGTWFYGGTPIERPRMVKLFSGVLRRDNGKYFLVTPVEKLGITVDDAPFVAVEMTCYGSGREQVLTFRTNVDDEVMAGPDHVIRVETDPLTGEPSPYVHVRDSLEALIARSVFYDLAELVQDEACGDGVRPGVWSAGRFFPLGDVVEPDLAGEG